MQIWVQIAMILCYLVSCEPAPLILACVEGGEGQDAKAFLEASTAILRDNTYLKMYLYEGTGRCLHILRKQFIFLCIFDMEHGADSQDSITTSSLPHLYYVKIHHLGVTRLLHLLLSTSSSLRCTIVYYQILSLHQSCNDRNVLECSEFNSSHNKSSFDFGLLFLN